MPTIDDVARAAGVGIGTVSRVLNDSPLVSAALRQRVLAAIERLGYRPNPVARAFASRRTHIIELLVPLFLGPIFLPVLQGIEDAVAEADYTLLVRTVEDREDRDRAFERCCARGRSDGALALWLVPPAAAVERFAAESFPIVLLNVSHPGLSSVGVDHDASARAAVKYCAGLGHERIALVDRPVDTFDPASPGICEIGYREAMSSANLDVRDGYEQKVDLSQTAGSAALGRLLNLAEPPTAVVAASDAQAIGVVQAARGRGWRVPADISVVGYSDSDYAQFLGISTIAVPLRELGREAAEVLLSAIAQPALMPQTVFRPGQLVPRKTCAPPRA